MSYSQDEKLEKAAGWLRDADGLLITAGAGIGVDLGLPDFRGAEGFWRAYRRFNITDYRLKTWPIQPVF